MASNTEQNLKQMRSNIKRIESFFVPVEKSALIILAMRSLTKARMHCGNTLKYITDNPTPYPNSTNPTNSIIEPYHVDKDIDVLARPEGFFEMNLTQKLKALRFLIDQEILKLDDVDKPIEDVEDWATITFISIFTNLTEAKNWLGEALGEIREQEGQPA